MYQLGRSCQALPKPLRKRTGWGAFSTTSRWMRSGCCIATNQASAAQSCPATTVEPAPRATIYSVFPSFVRFLSVWLAQECDPRP
jgi:hypothetical protein